jgi:ABC-2 type transport system permease protein
MTRTSLTKTLRLCRRELAAMYGGPLAWVLAAVFFFLTGYFFYSDLTFFVLVGGGNQARGLWRYMFLDFRLVALLVLPLLTMRLFAEERKQGTLELLWTWPVRDSELLAGKFLAALVVYLGMLASTVIGPVVLYTLHPFAIAPVVAGYTGMALLGVAFIACGIAASTVTDSQVVAAMLAYGVLVFSWFATWNEAAIGERIAPILLQLSLFDHFYGFAQGMIDSADVVYLLAFATLFLFLALRSLGTRAWRGIP